MSWPKSCGNPSFGAGSVRSGSLGAEGTPRRVRTALVGSVLVQFAQQGASGKNVVAHGGVDPVGIAGDGGGIRAVFVKGADGPDPARGLAAPLEARKLLGEDARQAHPPGGPHVRMVGLGNPVNRIMVEQSLNHGR